MVTAEDFGLTKGINYGVYDACKEGIVTCVSLLMNTKLTSHAFELVRPLDIGIGLSLNVTHGKPTSESKVLLEYGFLRPNHELTNEVLEAIESEYESQIQKAIDMDIEIRFFTSYNNYHLKHEAVYKKLQNLGKKYSLPVRGEYEYSDVFHGKRASADTLFLLFQQKFEWLELVVTPGFLCGELIELSDYREMRVVEHSILVNPYMRQMIKSGNIELVDRVY